MYSRCDLCTFINSISIEKCKICGIISKFDAILMSEIDKEEDIKEAIDESKNLYEEKMSLDGSNSLETHKSIDKTILYEEDQLLKEDNRNIISDSIESVKREKELMIEERKSIQSGNVRIYDACGFGYCAYGKIPKYNSMPDADINFINENKERLSVVIEASKSILFSKISLSNILKLIDDYKNSYSIDKEKEILSRLSANLNLDSIVKHYIHILIRHISFINKSSIFSVGLKNSFCSIPQDNKKLKKVEIYTINKPELMKSLIRKADDILNHKFSILYSYKYLCDNFVSSVENNDLSLLEPSFNGYKISNIIFKPSDKLQLLFMGDLNNKLGDYMVLKSNNIEYGMIVFSMGFKYGIIIILILLFIFLLYVIYKKLYNTCKSE